jgi:serine/threonine-protein kinase
MGEVYRAYDTLLRHQVALKMLLPPTGGDEETAEAKERMLREARAAARITHPNAVAVYDIGEEDGVVFLAMEFIAGKSLRAFVGDVSVPLGLRVEWLLDIARALGAAHALGLVHRDVKPENVMIGADGLVKILDFGIARRAPSPEAAAAGDALGTLTQEGVRLGTPAYMAPEQMRGDALDGRADQFAWGVMAYELLGGQRPWTGGGLALASQILAAEVPPLRALVPEVPEHVERAIGVALRKAPGDRFATMEAAVSALAEAAVSARAEAAVSARAEAARSAPAGEAKEAASPNVPSGVGPPTKRRAAFWLSGVAVVVAGVAAIAVHRGQLATAPPLIAVAAVDAGATIAPSEPSTNAEAAGAYRVGAAAFHNAALGAAFKQLNRAIELDPLFAAARIRRAFLDALLDRASSNEFKEDLQEARNGRASLGDRDRLLLEAFEPWARVPPDLDESLRRLASARATHPAEPELPFAAALVLDAAGHPPNEVEVALRAAIALDPTFAVAWKAIGPERLALGDVTGALQAYDECLVVSPVATSCLGDLSVLQANDGKCEELVRTSRTLISLAPDGPAPYLALADGLAGSGQPVETVRQALAQAWDREAADARPLSQVETEATLAILRGDFAAAEAKYAERRRLVAAAPDEDLHALGANEWALVELEEGRPAKAAELAEWYLRRRSAWSAGRADLSIETYVVELFAGTLTRPKFDALRDAWLSESPPGAAKWIAAYASAVRTTEDANAALAVRPPAQPLLTKLFERPSLMEAMGRVELLAGHDQAALPLLQAAATACFPLSMSGETIPATRAALEWGEALEATFDRDGACAAYQRVIARWGTASASVTAAEARRRQQALGCRR